MSNKFCRIMGGLLCVSTLGANEPLSLSSAYELALKNEPQLKSLWFQSKANAEGMEQVKARLYPQLQATASLGRYEYDAQYLNDKAVKENYTDYSITASQAIYHPEHWRGIDQAKTKQNAMQYQYKAQMQKLGLDVAKAYFAVLKESKSAELALAQKEYYEQKYKQQEEMLKFGLTNRIDLLETKIQRDKATSQWLNGQKRTQVSKLKLEHMIGEKVDQLKSFDFDNINTAKLAIQRNDWEGKIKQNPTFLMAQYLVNAAHDEIAIRNYEHYPKVDLTLNRKQTETSDPFAHSYDNQAILRMSIPLYQGGYTQSRVREGLSLLSSAQNEQEYYEKDTKSRFEEAWEDHQFRIENFNILKESQSSTDLYLQSVEKAHQSGLKSHIDVLEARAKTYEIKRDLIDAGYELINNHLVLLEVTGELNIDNIAVYEKSLN